jgi:hypothetical protein
VTTSTRSADGRFEIRRTDTTRVTSPDLWDAEVQWLVVRAATGDILATYTGTWGDTPDPQVHRTTGVIDVRFDGHDYLVTTDAGTERHPLPEDKLQQTSTPSDDGRFEIRYSQWSWVRDATYDLWEADCRWEVVSAGVVIATYTGWWGETPEPARETTGAIDCRFDGDGWLVKTGKETYERHPFPAAAT